MMNVEREHWCELWRLKATDGTNKTLGIDFLSYNHILRFLYEFAPAWMSGVDLA